MRSCLLCKHSELLSETRLYCKKFIFHVDEDDADCCGAFEVNQIIAKMNALIKKLIPPEGVGG